MRILSDGFIIKRTFSAGRSRTYMYLKEANEKVPDNPIMLYHLGMAYSKTENKGMAKKELAKALQLDPKFPRAEEAKATMQTLK